MCEMEIHRELPCHGGNYQKGRALPIRYIVIHYVGALGNAAQNARYYATTPGIQASAHYFVGRASEGRPIYASVPEGDTAWHCGRGDGRYRHPECRNANSIGIEMCCRRDGGGVWSFDPETVERTADLTRDIMRRYRIPVERVVRHYDVTGKNCPAPFVEDSGAWRAFLRRLEGPNMTKTEFEALYGQVNPEYTGLEQVPAYWRADAEKLISAGALRGDGVHPICIRKEGLQALVAAMRYAEAGK